MSERDKNARELMQARLSRDPHVYLRARPGEGDQTAAVRVVTAKAQTETSARQEQARQQRLEAAANGAEVVVPVDLGVLPAAGVCGELVLQDSLHTTVVFNAVYPGADGPVGAGTAVVRFRLAKASRFGLPNDEALGGHPLYDRGLEYYALGEVLNSSWAVEAERHNRVCFPNSPAWKARRFIFTFHDSTFECLADDLQLELSTRPRRALLAELSAEFEH